jgi:hypothetical protein
MTSAGPEALSEALLLDHDLCDRAHFAATTPRWLCGHRWAGVGGQAETAFLDVSVSLCSSQHGDPFSAAIVAAVGEFSVTTIDEAVSTALVDYVRFARNVVIDFSRLVTIDHRGALMLDELDGVASRAGGSLVVHEPSGLVEHVIRFCGVSDRIRICSAR